MSKVSLLGVKITTDSKLELLQYVAGFLAKKSQNPLTIVTPNPEQIVYAQKDATFKNILNAADIALPDGIGVVWALNVLKNNAPQPPLTKRGSRGVVEKIPGVEFMENLCDLAAKNGWPIGLLGGRGGVAKKALDKLQQKYPGLKGWAEDAPEVRIEKWEMRNEKLDLEIGNETTRIQDNKKISLQNPASYLKFLTSNSGEKDYLNSLIYRIKQYQTRILFVGLGAPKQEYFIEKLKNYFTLYPLPLTLILMSVGGSFDEIAGVVPRAPQLISDIGLKWLWRLVLQPWRIKRQLSLMQFIYLTLCSKEDKNR